MKDKLNSKLPPNKQILVCHPMQQHSIKLAEALHKSNILYKYCTTVYYNEKKLLYRILRFILGKDKKQRLLGKISNLPNEKIITFSSIFGLFYLVLARVDKKNIILPNYARFLRRNFGKKVAKFAIKSNVYAVVIYDTWGYYTLKYLKKHSKIKTIMDMSSIPAEEIVKIIEEDTTFENNQYYEIMMRRYRRSFLDEYKKELSLSDNFLVPSSFSKSKLINVGIDENRIFVIKYGVDFSQFVSSESVTNEEKILNILYVGRLTPPKGILYLLNAMRELNNPRIKLTCVGTVFDGSLLDVYGQYFTHIKNVPKNEIHKYYEGADIYIMPSLFEGMSLTLLEAIAMELPIIATTNTGASDLIDNKIHGLIIQSMSSLAIKTAIIELYNNKNIISTFKNNIKKIKNNYSWTKYNYSVQNVFISEIID